jgi:hypothetical protein
MEAKVAFEQLVFSLQRYPRLAVHKNMLELALTAGML